MFPQVEIIIGMSWWWLSIIRGSNRETTSGNYVSWRTIVEDEIFTTKRPRYPAIFDNPSALADGSIQRPNGTHLSTIPCLCSAALAVRWIWWTFSYRCLWLKRLISRPWKSEGKKPGRIRDYVTCERRLRINRASRSIVRKYLYEPSELHPVPVSVVYRQSGGVILKHRFAAP